VPQTTGRGSGSGPGDSESRLLTKRETEGQTLLLFVQVAIWVHVVEEVERDDFSMDARSEGTDIAALTPLQMTERAKVAGDTCASSKLRRGLTPGPARRQDLRAFGPGMEVRPGRRVGMRRAGLERKGEALFRLI
jgi:hypothetical protein